MKPEEIKSWDVKPWPLESDYESLSNVAKIVSWYLSDACLCVGSALRTKYYDDPEVEAVAKYLFKLADDFDGNTGFPDLTDYLDERLGYMQEEIEKLKAANKGREMRKILSEIEFAYKAGKQAVLFDRSRWINDVGNSKEAK